MSELTDTTKKEINPEHVEVIKAALVGWYSGKYSTLTDALNAAEVGKTTYYKYKKDLPAEMDKLDREAKRAALLERSGKQIAFEAEVIEDSIDIQRQAIEALREAIPQLASIAAGESREIEVTDKKGNPYTKTIVPYPRDVIAAATQLQQLARGGVMPEHYAEVSAADEGKGSPLDVLLTPARSNFKQITATAPDGTKVTATVEHEGDIVDAEVIE